MAINGRLSCRRWPDVHLCCTVGTSYFSAAPAVLSTHAFPLLLTSVSPHSSPARLYCVSMLMQLPRLAASGSSTRVPASPPSCSLPDRPLATISCLLFCAAVGAVRDSLHTEKTRNMQNTNARSTPRLHGRTLAAQRRRTQTKKKRKEPTTQGSRNPFDINNW